MRFFPRDEVVAHLFHTLLLAWAALVAASFLLSAFGVLYPILLVALLAGGAIGVFYRARTGDPTCATSGARVAQRAVRHEPRSASRFDRWWLAWLGYASFAAAAALWSGLLEFPRDFDSLAYHLPFVDEWLHAASLNTTQSSSWFHPGNNELMGLWCVGLFSGDFLIALNNLPAVAVLGLGTRELARQLGARRATAHVAGLAAMTPHVVVRQLLDCENDVAAAGLFVAALACGVRCAYVPRAANVLLWAVSIGLLPGVKYYALGYAAAAGLGITAITLRVHGSRVALTVATAGVIGVALLSGYWYLRNAALTGTPFFPKGVPGAAGILAETQPRLWQTTLLGAHDPALAPLLVRAIWISLGAAHCTACLAAPVTMALLIARGLRRRADRRAVAAAVVACLFLVAALIFAITPFVVETVAGSRNMLKEGYLPGRFLLSAASLAIALLTLFIDALASVVERQLTGNTFSASDGPPWSQRLLRRAARQGMRWIFAVLAVTQIWPWRFLLGHHPDPLLMLGVGANVFLIGLLMIEACRTWPALRLGRVWLGALVILACVAIPALADRWHRGFAKFYDRYYNTRLFTKLDRDGRVDMRICPLLYRPYPFFGSRRQYDVLGPVWAPKYESLLEYLESQQPDWVVTHPGGIAGSRGYHLMCNWLDWTEEWKQTYRESHYCVYQAAPERGKDRADKTLSALAD